jgi:hypothetical protein
MFEIEMLPAREGDALWIRYGSAKKIYQILIDAGRRPTAKELSDRLATMPPHRRVFELLIITHIDRDHIEGALHLLASPIPKFKEVWFNGYDHLLSVSLESFGPVQAERLTKLLSKNKLPWNQTMKGEAVCLRRGLRCFQLPSGMKLTLFSPDPEKLEKLIPVWERECRKAGLERGFDSSPSEPPGVESFGELDVESLASEPFLADSGESNGSTIAVLAEYAGKKALLTGDAHVDRLIKSIKKFKGRSRRLKVDAFKVPHHASARNLSSELLILLKCRRFLISTNGAYFRHPSPQAIARILKFAGERFTLFFNYQTRFTTIWDDPIAKEEYRYEVVYPTPGHNGNLTVSL